MDAKYARLDGAVVANNKVGLLSGTLQNSISITEYGTAVTTYLNVWTNTNVDGTAARTTPITTCHDWTSYISGDYAPFGNASSQIASWTDSAGSLNSCSTDFATIARLYCFDQFLTTTLSGDTDGDGTTNANDCNPYNSTIYQIKNVTKDTDQDGYSPNGGGSSDECVGSSTLVGTINYYKDTNGLYTWKEYAAPVTPDCHDGNATVNPGVGGYFNTPYTPLAGGSSYDYNCSGAEEKQFIVTTLSTQSCSVTAPNGFLGFTSTTACGATGNFRICRYYSSFSCPDSSLIGPSLGYTGNCNTLPGPYFKVEDIPNTQQGCH